MDLWREGGTKNQGGRNCSKRGGSSKLGEVFLCPSLEARGRTPSGGQVLLRKGREINK